MKEKKATKILIVVLAAMLTLGSAIPVWAAADKDGARTDAKAREKALRRITNSDIFNFQRSKSLLKLQEDAGKYPDSFDLRNVDTNGDGKGDKSFVTKVKTQNPFGTCWGFSAIAAVESSLIASGFADQSIDLSEKHVSYFVNTFLDDPNSPQNGEGTHFRTVSEKGKKTSAYKYETGGVTFMATSVFASGIGPVIETDDPGDIFGYHGLNSERVFWNVATHYDENNKPVPESYARKPVWYSTDDDWSIPEDLRFVQDYRLKESIVLPDPAGSDEKGKYVYNKASIDAIKQQMYDHHRAVNISFCAESYLPGQDTSDKKYMSSNWAHYTSEQQYSNHSVTVVGWDDNYPAENFLKTPVDENGNTVKGAFLIKNSWGSELNEFPNNAYRHWGLLEGMDGVPYDPNAKAKSDKATGYFWISYADQSLNDPEAFVFDAVTKDDPCYTEQTDFMTSTFIVGEPFTNCWEANVFQAEATSSLSAVSVFTGTPDTEVSYEIYLLPDDYDSPEDGIKIGSGKETFEYGGYHRIDLRKPTVVAKGQKYSVLMQLKAPEEGEYICHSVDVNRGKNYYSVGVINPGESYMFYGTKWHDLSEKSTQKIICDYYGGYYDLTFDNFPIKTYLKPITYPDGEKDPVFNGYLTVSNWQEGNPGMFNLEPEQSKTIAAEFRGISKDMPDSWNPDIKWTSTDESVFTVTPQTPDNGRADIKGVAPGKAILKVDAGEYGVRLLNIVVGKPEPPKPEQKDNTLTAKGKTVTVKGATTKGLKKNKTITKAKAYTIKDPVGTVTFKKANKSGGSKIAVNKTTGKITAKKGLKKGTYKVKVKITAAGNEEYKVGSQTVTVKIVVKK